MITLARRMAFVGLISMTLAGCATPTPPPQQPQTEQTKEMSNNQARGYSVALLKIPVSNIKRSAAFYHDTFGFEQESIYPEYGWAQLKAGELPLALYKPGMGGGDGHIGGSTGFHLSLPADRFDTLAAALLVQGVLVENRVHHGDDGTVYLEVRDPDGNTLKINRGAD
jgi:catechol 2,3-dioxygenase-like lactoylglutathione lyase family enzyme